MSEYKWKTGHQITVDANTCGPVLEAIAAKHEGECPPEAVVKEARKTRSPLHPHFEWDDHEAAELYRVAQARDLIRHIVILDDNIPEGEREIFCRIEYARRDHHYIDARIVAADPDLRAAFLSSILAECGKWRRRYNTAKEVLEAIGAVESLVVSMK